MPFTPEDVKKHTKAATTDELKRQWIEVANNVLDSCIEAGGTDETCAPKAIQQANGVIRKRLEREKRKKNGNGQQEVEVENTTLQIAESAIEIGLALAHRTHEITDARAAKLLSKLEAELAEAAKTKTVDGEGFPASDFLVGEPDKPSTWHLQVKRHGKPDHALMGAAKAALTSPGGHRGNQYEGPDKAAAIKALKALYAAEEMEWTEAAAELDSDVLQFGYDVRAAFERAFEPETRWMAEKPPTLRTRSVFYEHPDLGDVIIVYDRDKDACYAVPYTKSEDGIKFVVRQEWEPVKQVWMKVEASAPAPAEEPAVEPQAAPEYEAEAFAECADGVTLVEDAAPAVDGTRAPLKLHVRLIRPGFGNQRDGHYYPADVLARDAHVFEGVKMYPVDHQQAQKSAANEVGVVDKIVRFDDGAPVAQVTIFNPDFAEQVRNRAAAGKLGTLECSILAQGTTRKGQVDGKAANIVEAITAAQSVDWVTRAGAGGQALNIAEGQTGTCPEQSEGGASQDDTGGVIVESEPRAPDAPVQELPQAEAPAETAPEQVEGAAPIQEGQPVEQPKVEAVTPDPAPVQEAQPTPAVLSEVECAAVLDKAQLPDPAKAKLARSQYADRQALEQAINEMAELLSAVAQSGRPLRPVAARTAAEKRTLAEMQAAQDAVNARWFGRGGR